MSAPRKILLHHPHGAAHARAMTRHEAFIQKNWETGGLASVVVTRVRGDGAAEYGLFLVDLFCLGVKDASFEANLTANELRAFVAERLPEEFKERIHPACAKKLIEGALAYADKLGFAPHVDFRKARKVLSGLDASDCPQEFTFGRDGRPCYIRGEDDSEERVDRILAILENRCGADGFDYEDPADDDLDDDEDDAREDLLDWFADRDLPEQKFYELSGLLTALLLSPAGRGPAETIRVLWNEDTPLKTMEDAQEFLGLLMAYWNELNSFVLDTVSPDAEPGLSPVDIWEEDFAEDDELSLFAATAAWAAGFDLALQTWPEDWKGPHSNPALAAHWEVLGWWVDFEAEGNLDRIAAGAEATPPRLLVDSIAALTRALRQPID